MSQSDSTPGGWQRACARFVREAGAGQELLPLLAAFGRPGDDPASGRPFAALDHGAQTGQDALSDAIVAALSGEVDHDQAAMFARRYRAVAGLLDELCPRLPPARVLRVGLWRRLHDVLAAAAPRALRVRAVIDFYYSQAAVLRHRQDQGPRLAERLAALRWTTVAPGIEHALLDGRIAAGPLHINLLRVAPGCPLLAWDNREHDLLDQAAARGAVAATSGGFFLYSEADIAPPSARHDLVGLLVSDGEVVSPPVLRRTALLVAPDGGRALGRLGPEDTLLHASGVVLAPVSTNTAPAALPPTHPLGVPVAAYNRAYGPHSPAGPGAVITVVGHAIVSRGQGAAPIPLNGLVLLLPAGVAPPPCGPLSWTLRQPLQAAMAGGPRLLREGVLDRDRVADDLAGTAPPVTFSQDETFDQNLLPRLVVGLQPSGTAVFAAIDGRNVDRAPGMTLQGAAGLLAGLACTDAVNLDGGSSKRMAVAGRLVDLATTEVVAGAAQPARLRPVHSAIGIRARS